MFTRTLLPRICSAALLLAGVGTAQELPRLLRPVADSVELSVDPGRAQLDSLRQRLVRVDSTALAALSEGAFAIELALFDDTVLRLVPERIDVDGLADLVVTGRLDSQPLGSFALASQNGHLAVRVNEGTGRRFLVRSLEAPIHEVLELAEPVDDSCAVERSTSPGAPAPFEPPGGGAQEAATVQVDVLMAYTPDALAMAGNECALLADIEAALAEMNMALLNSQTLAKVEMVGFVETPYNEEVGGASYQTHLDRLEGDGDNFMDELHDLRNLVGADLVALIIDDHGLSGSGIANVLQSSDPDYAKEAFSVTHYPNMVASMTLSHELGHNFGCAHDEDNIDANGYYVYSYGHRWFGNSGTQWRTIMAYSPGVGIPYFSDPDIDFDGVPTGFHQPGPFNLGADNSRTIANTKFFLVAHRFTVDPLATVYCDFTYNGTETGSLSQPYGSYKAAMMRVAPGGTVVFLGGHATVQAPLFCRHVRLSGSQGGAKIGI